MKRIIPAPLEMLSPGEKRELRDFMEGQTYQKLLSIVENFKPSSNCLLAGSGTRDAFANDRANARLGEIRGWDLHVAALFAPLAPKAKLQRFLQESFPDEGGMPLTPPEQVS